MMELTIKISDKLRARLPSDRRLIEKILRLGLERYEAKQTESQRRRGVVRATFGALPLKNHELIREIIEEIPA